MIWLKISLYIGFCWCQMAAALNIRDHQNWPHDMDNECGISYTDRIIGGTNASLGQYPWLARLAYMRQNTLRHYCGGALINQWYVLTAAHCVSSKGTSLISYIMLGEHDVDAEIDCEDDICADPLQTFRPKEIITHPNYNNPTFKHDIALIRLDRPAEVTDWVLPICLPSGEILSSNYDIAEVAGWGLLNSLDTDTSTILKTVKLPIVPMSICADTYESNRVNLGDEQLCVGGVIGRDSCSGDSGGPLIKAANGALGPRYYLIGIVSFGSKWCGETTAPAIYTNANHYILWILENMKKVE